MLFTFGICYCKMSHTDAYILCDNPSVIGLESHVALHILHLKYLFTV